MGMPELERGIEAAQGLGGSFFAGPREASLVAAAEVALGVALPPTYRRFVTELGAGNAGSREFYWCDDRQLHVSVGPERNLADAR